MTLAVRGNSQHSRTRRTFGCNAAVPSFDRHRPAHTLSNAPETSEQYTATRWPVARAASQVRRKHKTASRAPRSG
eukprot:3063444-Alexandrium_andersonii.AAC.1